jgi:hypothetical protein
MHNEHYKKWGYNTWTGKILQWCDKLKFNSSHYAQLYKLNNMENPTSYPEYISFPSKNHHYEATPY